MKPQDLVLRCYAERKHDHWQAFCIDLCLAAQGDSFEDVREKIHEQIAEYVYDALEGEDKEFADQLLTRKAPPYHIAKFHAYDMIGHYRSFAEKIANGIRTYTEMMPVHVQARA